MDKCETCQYFVQSPHQEELKPCEKCGACHFFPPSLHGVTNGNRWSGWPAVRLDGWCGQHRDARAGVQDVRAV